MQHLSASLRSARVNHIEDSPGDIDRYGKSFGEVDSVGKQSRIVGYPLVPEIESGGISFGSAAFSCNWCQLRCRIYFDEVWRQAQLAAAAINFAPNPWVSVGTSGFFGRHLID